MSSLAHLSLGAAAFPPLGNVVVTANPCCRSLSTCYRPGAEPGFPGTLAVTQLSLRQPLPLHAPALLWYNYCGYQSTKGLNRCRCSRRQLDRLRARSERLGAGCREAVPRVLPAGSPPGWKAERGQWGEKGLSRPCMDLAHTPWEAGPQQGGSVEGL